MQNVPNKKKKIAYILRRNVDSLSLSTEAVVIATNSNLAMQERDPETDFVTRTKPIKSPLLLMLLLRLPGTSIA